MLACAPVTSPECRLDHERTGFPGGFDVAVDFLRIDGLVQRREESPRVVGAVAPARARSRMAPCAVRVSEPPPGPPDSSPLRLRAVAVDAFGQQRVGQRLFKRARRVRAARLCPPYGDPFPIWFVSSLPNTSTHSIAVTTCAVAARLAPTRAAVRWPWRRSLTGRRES